MKKEKEIINVWDKGNHIQFIGINGEYYKINKDVLDKTVSVSGVLFSYWINKIMNESWCTMDALYQFAIILKEEYANSEIDLEIQLYMIEFEELIKDNLSYVRAAFDGKLTSMDMLDNNNNYLRVLKSIAFRVEENFSTHYESLDYWKNN